MSYRNVCLTNKFMVEIERERRQGRTCLFRCDKIYEFKTFVNWKSLFKVLQDVCKYHQICFSGLIHIYYIFYQRFNGFKIIVFQPNLEASHVFVSCLTYLEIGSCEVYNEKSIEHLQKGLAYLLLLTANYNVICFDTNYSKPTKSKVKVTVNGYKCYLSHTLIHLLNYSIKTLKVKFTLCTSKCSITDSAVYRFVPYFSLLIYITFNRILTLIEIRKALIIAGIESNPGPELKLISKLKIVTINCNGLTYNL